MAADNSGLRTLAVNDLMNVRMEGLILAALVDKKILTAAQVRGLIDDVLQNAPEHSALSPAYQSMRDEFPE